MNQEELQISALSLLKTLNEVEVHGKENLTKLLACIQHLEEVSEQLNQREGDES